LIPCDGTVVVPLFDEEARDDSVVRECESAPIGEEIDVVEERGAECAVRRFVVEPDV